MPNEKPGTDPQLLQNEKILSLAPKEAIREFGMEGARQTLEDRGFDLAQIDECVRKNCPFGLGTVTDATPVSVFEKLIDLKKKEGDDEEAQALSKIKEAYLRGYTGPLKAELAQLREHCLERAEVWVDVLPPKNSKHESTPLFLVDDKWRLLENREKSIQSLAGFYFLENSYKHAVVTRALSQIPEKI